MSDAPSPDVLRQLVGRLLARWRSRAGLSLEQVVAQAKPHIRLSPPTLSRWESGVIPTTGKARRTKIEPLLRLYGATDDEVAATLRLAERAAENPWWYEYRAELPEWTRTGIAYADSATLIHVYEPHRVPGLLQTADYARALLGTGPGVDRRIEVLMRRQAILNRPHPPQLWALLDESVLRRQVSDPAVMQQQVKHLLELSTRPRITIQVVPLAAGPNRRTAQPFNIFRLAPIELPDVVERQMLDDHDFTDDQHTVAQYMDWWGQATEFQSPAETQSLLSAIIAESGDTA
ncbi:helix-turn-helix transcriptional regulator [Streptomyces sp. XD-27]|uniref:helix-turn-helix domain-containing protein n=1 Tax=Streptomyces sp. XD-27 TaxID=3062779 RepID=UPI0026F46FB8|nr:helix-turn-helix transcriptional regulator [Streptomyces sp. XD-27]WKX70065.1 helix-turn-helix transcriptional regulator [Streptomyces sp. XD-27]